MFFSVCSPKSSKARSSRPGDVFQRLLAQIVKSKVKPPGRVLLNSGRHTDSAGFGQAFEAGCDVHASTEDVPVLNNDIALMNADPKFDAVAQSAGTPFGHAVLPFGRTAQRINDAAEFDQISVTGRFDDAPTIFGDTRVNSLAADRPKKVEGSCLVNSDQPRIARHIGG